MPKKNWEIQDEFKYKLPNWLGAILGISLGSIIWGILNKDIWSIFVGVIESIVFGIGIWVDYAIKKKKSLRPKPQTTVEVTTALLDK